MKKFFIILSIVAALLYAAHTFGFWTWLETARAPTTDYRRELDSLRHELMTLRKGQAEIKEQLDSVLRNQSDFKSELDTLKQGQVIIYNEVKKAADKSFWDLF